MIVVTVPPSKSVTQRALILAFLSDGPCAIENPLVCDDSRVLGAALEALGARIERTSQSWKVQPPARLAACDQPLRLGNAGTAVRFLTGVSILLGGTTTIDGDPAMHRRPMAGLLDALRKLGANVEELGAPSCPPVRITAPPSVRSSVRLDASASSQQLSALLLAGSRLPGFTIQVDSEIPSAPYVRLTVEALDRFGVTVNEEGSTFHVAGGPPRCDRFVVDGDWSSASYPLAAAWLSGRETRLEGVRDDSSQGDRAIVDLLAALETPGARRLDMGHCPDLVPTVAACALFAEGETEVCGAAHLRIKESNRIEGLVTELGRLGADVEELEDGLRIRPGAALTPAMLGARSDHRLAMAFGLVSLRVPGIEVDEPSCVSKSYPEFWPMLERFR